MYPLTRIPLILLTLTLICTVGGAQESSRTPLVIPNLPTADMQMSWTDFKELLALIQPKEEEAPEEEVPPWAWSIPVVEYKADATRRGVVLIDATYTIQVWDKRWTKIPLLGADVAIVSAMMDGEPALLNPDSEWFTLLVDEPGRHQVTVRFQVATVEHEGDVGFGFKVQPSSMTHMVLRLGTDETRVHAAAASGIRITRSKDALEADLVLRSSDNVAVGWRHPVAKKVDKPVQPPRVTSEASTLITVTEGYLDCHTTIQYEVLRGTVEQFSVILPKEAIVLGVDGKGAGWTSTDTEAGQRVDVNVNHGVSGSYTTTMRYELPISDSDPAIVVPRLSTVNVARQTGYIAVTARGNVRVNPGEFLEHVSRVDIASLPEPLQKASTLPILHAYKYTQPEYVVTLSAFVEQPHVASRTSTLLTVGDRVLSCSTQIHYNVLRGEVNRLAFSLPDTINLLGITGAGAEWSSKEMEGRLEVTVNLNETVRDQYVLTVKYELPLPETSETLIAPELLVHDTNRQTGYFAITTGGNIKIDANATTDITRIDETELPQILRQESPYPVLHAFQYFQPGYRLALDVQRLEDVAVRVVSIDDAELTTVITEEGLAITRARYQVRNHVSQFLRIKLGADAVVWGAQVNGAPVTPAHDADTNAVLLPLMKSVQRTMDSAPFVVELVYKEDIPPLGGIRSTLSLKAPSTDILANKVRWEVLLPESRTVRSVDGDLKSVARPAVLGRGGRGSGGSVFGGPGDRGAPKSLGKRTIRHIRMGVERFLITDINGPASSSSSRGLRTYSGQQLPAARPESASQRLAGVLPIRVKLPEVGTSHYFERTLVKQGVALSLELKTIDRRLARAHAWTALVLAVACGFILSRLLYRLRHQKTSARSAGLCAGLLLLTVVLASGSMATNQGLVALAVTGFVAEIAPRWWKKRQERRAAMLQKAEHENEETSS